MASPLLSLVRADPSGAVAIETALVVPVLVLLSLGAFQVSMLVARQNELQSAVAEAATIVLAAKPETPAEIQTIENVLEDTAGLGPEQVSITKVFRCGDDEDHVAASDLCDPEAEVSTFLRILVTDTLTPRWAGIGFGRPIEYRVVRTIQLS
jgi:hypothetical protein